MLHSIRFLSVPLADVAKNEAVGRSGDVWLQTGGLVGDDTSFQYVDRCPNAATGVIGRRKDLERTDPAPGRKRLFR